MKYQFDPIEDAIQEVKKGRLVIIMDSKDREYEGDLVGAAALVTPETINFMVTEARGAYIAIFMPAGRCDELEIPPMGVVNHSFNQTKFRVSVDAKSNVSGSSAYDRAESVRLLGDPRAKESDFVRPGHVVPIEANPKGLLGRKGHTEAGVELVKLAGINPPVAVDLEILDADGHMAHEETLFEMAKKHKLKIISIDELHDYVAAKKKPAVRTA